VSRYKVVVAARADGQIARAVAWWRKHRPAAPMLLLEELGDALDLVATAPQAGIPYAYRGRVAGVRRLLLPGARYHLYYTIDEETRVVTVRVLWHATRGRGPAL
jgi:plasmid stabilization system protein ParE